MPAVVFLQADGIRREVQAPVGITVMEIARQHGIGGVVAQCGGACACATCHVYVEPSWLNKLEPPEEMEAAMLGGAWEPRRNSRLSCQVQMSEDLDGLQVFVPLRQAG